jgi:CRISPR-associated protein Cas2
MSKELQFVLIVYDISNDRRRTRLHDLLLDFGTPVQYSAFECRLSEKDILKLKNGVKRIIRPRKDNVRYYHLCADCIDAIEASRPGEINKSTPVETLVV